MSTEAAVAPMAVSKSRAPMTEEHKRKLAEGRERARAAKAGVASPAVATPAQEEVPALPAKAKQVDLLAEIERLTIENEEIRKAAGILNPSEVEALPKTECYYEYNAGEKNERDEQIAGKITTLDDPTWKELVVGRRSVTGHVIVKALTRAKSGEIIDRVDVSCVPMKSPQAALTAMQSYTKNPNSQWY